MLLLGMGSVQQEGNLFWAVEFYFGKETITPAPDFAIAALQPARVGSISLDSEPPEAMEQQAETVSICVAELDCHETWLPADEAPADLFLG